MTMMSLRRVLPIKAGSVARVALAAVLFTVSFAASGQSAPAVSTIVAFSGSVPSGGVVKGDDGALYGTGTSNSIVSGGVVYRSTLDGLSVKTLHQFQGAEEGSAPKAGLVIGSDGLLYGSTRLGAARESFSTGTTYRLATDGSGFTILHRFEAWATRNSHGDPINTDGAYPDATLIEGSDGDLYGVTTAGGANGTGVVFRQSRDGSSFTVLHEFAHTDSPASDSLVKNDDGAAPEASLLQATDGYLYGTASTGGPNGRGTIFRLHTDGSGFEVVHVFSDLTGSPGTNVDGALPLSGLIDGQDGLLYGVANVGGAIGYGTIYSLDPNSPDPNPDPSYPDLRLVTTIHDFDTKLGAFPVGALLLGLDGKLYGTTQGGGTDTSDNATTLGTIFVVARDGTGFARLFSFDGKDGSAPNSPLLQIDADSFAGTTPAGGRCSQGTVYRFSLSGATITGNTTCGQKKKNQSGGGGTEPLVILLFGALGLTRRRRRA